MQPFNLNLEVEVDKNTGKTLAVYFQIRKGKAADVREIVDGVAYANYNRKGLLLGVELLAPCKISILDRIAHKEPIQIKRFLRDSIPRKMALAS